ncbi:MAG: phosphodiester glycosidase family protein [Planctomycetota bacterium]
MIRLVGILVFALAGFARAEPLTITTVEYETDVGTARGWLATIDLTDPAVELFVSDTRNDEGVPVRVPTDEWAEANDVTLATNANFFGAREIVGLCISDGQLVSDPRGNDPVLLIFDGRAEVVAGEAPKLEGVRHAVAGVGASETAPVGTAILKDGQNIGEAARVEAFKRHPRTGAGVDESGTTLFLLVVDGRQPGHSVGVTLRELAELMIQAGADDALNLDGGGSSAFVYRNKQGQWQGNRPSGGTHRPVPNHIGIRVHRVDSRERP